MNSSGIRRGLAATAISALAVTGVPFLATSASANPVNDQVTDVTLFSQFTGTTSLKDDGTGTNTIRLEAGAPAAVTSVSFSYTLPGGTPQVIQSGVTRNDDGAFSYEWSPANNIIGTTVDITVTGTTANGPGNSDTVAGVTINAAGAPTTSVDLAAKSQAGVFQQPYGGNNNRKNVIVSGTTSGPGSVNLRTINPNVNATAQAQSTVPTGGNVAGYKGVLDINGYVFGNTNELVVGAEFGSDDVESYTLYNQTLGSFSATATNPNVPAGGSSPVTFSVLDQFQQPIAGARVQRQTAVVLGQPIYSTVGFTNANGEIPGVTQPAGESRTYIVDATNQSGYDANLGDLQQTVTVGQFTPAPTTLVESPAVTAFDLDEMNSVTIQAQDQNGNPFNVNSNNQTLNYYFVVTPFDGSAAKRFPATGTTALPVAAESGGLYTVPLPAGAGSGSYELFASLSPNTANGTGAIAESKVADFKAGQATVTYAPSGDQSVAAGGQVSLTGTLALEDGTGLAGRDVTATYAQGNVGSDPVKDAGIVPATAGAPLVGSRTFTTAADGTFTVVVDDPAETPQGTEVGGSLTTTVPAVGPIATGPVGIDFAQATAPAGSTIVVTDDTGITPGLVEDGTVTVSTPDADNDGVREPVIGQLVTLTIDHGKFTDGTPAATPVVGQPAGAYTGTQTVTVTTDGNGEADFSYVIGRDEGFDDDGLVDAKISATGPIASTGGNVQFDSTDPLNPGTITIVPSPADQQDNPIDPAPVFGSVTYDLETTDQFGNRVAVDDNDIDLSISGSSQDTDIFDEDGSDFDDDGDFTVFGYDDGDYTITAEWTVSPTFIYTTATGDGAPTFNFGGRTVSDTESVTFYDRTLSEANTTLVSSPEGDVAVGTTVLENITVIDASGQPYGDLDVNYVVTSPSGVVTQGVRTTDASGKASFPVATTEAGTYQVTATVSNGTETVNVSDSITATGAPDNTPKAVTARLTGPNNGGKTDKLKLATIANDGSGAVADSAVAKMYKINLNGKAVLVKTKVTNEAGTAKLGAFDRNGNKRTKYFVVVSATNDTLKTTSNTRALK